jgi:SAM-dependent methyltransferase
MSEALDDVFGWELLQLGLWGPRDGLLSGCRTRRHAVVADRRSQSNDADIVARLAQLPIANGVVDAVVLPHTLEFETDPYAVVREADRVLAPEGQLVVLGFRPFSLWGFRSRAISRGYPPGLKRMLEPQLSIRAALGWQRAAGRRTFRAVAPGLAQALARGCVSHQGAQTRVHVDAVAAEIPRTHSGHRRSGKTDHAASKFLSGKPNRYLYGWRVSRQSGSRWLGGAAAVR